MNEFLPLPGKLEEKLGREQQRRDRWPGHHGPAALPGHYLGISQKAAMVLATELGDIRHFPNPRSLISFGQLAQGGPARREMKYLAVCYQSKGIWLGR